MEAAARQEAGLKTKQAANEAEVRRLTRTQQDLRAALQAEIAKGDVAVSQDQDRLAVQLVDRILFDSGQVDLSEEGIDILNRVSDVLKTVRDKQIRIEGHTDDLPIGPKLRERFPTNWELSTSRAITVVRYLIERGEVDPSLMSAAGYADTRPLESNDLKEGRTKNRRIEILLYPKDLPVLAYRASEKPDERE